MARVFNFSAGPAALPLEVLEEAQAGLTDWQGSGMSVMEVSHRSKPFIAVAEQAEADIRELMNISDDYSVMFLQGGATQQFALIPMNLSDEGQTIDQLVTGSWSKKALKEGKALRNVNVVADGADSNYADVPAIDSWQLTSDAAYFHYCANETIGGLEFHAPPETGGVPLVADMSSTILSRPIDVNKFGLIYAGAQKNIGPAGLTIVIVRKDLLKEGRPGSNILNYKAHAEGGSMMNTPPTFAWYMAGLVFAWIKRNGGLEGMGEFNQSKAAKLYAAIDGSDFYANPVALDYRSWMNIPFTLAKPELDGDFLAKAEAAGLMNLKGHRSVGGMRASIYNAVSMDAIDALVSFMEEFERSNA
ncbi:MAG: 3-phosphoserine/phosphohydroxythreonine transaminase [Gammaproteobacteria bacterium]|nr:3-phosphoserine/phosphohydroxythreonine transaminase [Gammaproteobacteria bacterium]MCP4090866.1 3-phosphoserine/phosphohydroxythreonine transaminase [Gammaproteobacteria bacterium]MCP4275526.1 3-phosphoserine/phosphohydroxythreonine transaminase [Gammaproteobacteria bacterium]MCP4832248.1 3-phosphoserine/phosphohydroxythreonine transaminase [Gammaproteobacteria bacterium]MCP4930302.1 3-phosphoserine/phosphohydroxythreonine transaminase [Gammaproteobacteria bacterium]